MWRVKGTQLTEANICELSLNGKQLVYVPSVLVTRCRTTDQTRTFANSFITKHFVPNDTLTTVPVTILEDRI
jgi:hypothetical protein